MIVRLNNLYVGDVSNENCLVVNNNTELYKNAIFFDLEHYVYKKPICVGVFGCCFFNEENKCLEVTQYMIENREESNAILLMAQEYFQSIQQKYNKNYIITFSGNNDFTIINYLFQKNNIKYVIKDHYEHLDLQKQYEKDHKKSIGLKNLEKEFNIERDSELISGQNLAKTFSKIMKDDDYIKRMPDDKKQKILLYNEQDVVNLFHIYVNWNKLTCKESET